MLGFYTLTTPPSNTFDTIPWRYIYPPPPPYNLRPLGRWWCRRDRWVGMVVTFLTLPPLAGIAIQHSLSPSVVMMLWCGLGVVRWQLREWAHVDSLVTCLITWAAFVHPHNPYVALLILVITTLLHETTPVIAAAVIWSPLPLLLLVIPLALTLINISNRLPSQVDWEGIKSFNPTLRLPNIRLRISQLLNFSPHHTLLHHIVRRHFSLCNLVSPWGVTVLALIHPTPQVVCALVVGYAQMAVATDYYRLYQRTHLPIIISSASLLSPLYILPLLILLHLLNPLHNGQEYDEDVEG